LEFLEHKEKGEETCSHFPDKLTKGVFVRNKCFSPPLSAVCNTATHGDGIQKSSLSPLFVQLYSIVWETELPGTLSCADSTIITTGQ